MLGMIARIRAGCGEQRRRLTLAVAIRHTATGVVVPEILCAFAPARHLPALALVVKQESVGHPAFEIFVEEAHAAFLPCEIVALVATRVQAALLYFPDLDILIDTGAH